MAMIGDCVQLRTQFVLEASSVHTFASTSSSGIWPVPSRQLQSLEAYFQRQTEFAFYASSLLLECFLPPLASERMCAWLGSWSCPAYGPVHAWLRCMVLCALVCGTLSLYITSCTVSCMARAPQQQPPRNHAGFAGISAFCCHLRNCTLASYDAALGDSARLRVSMIDFAHVSTDTHGRLDEGYLLGLRTLLGIVNRMP